MSTWEEFANLRRIFFNTPSNRSFEDLLYTITSVSSNIRVYYPPHRYMTIDEKEDLLNKTLRITFKMIRLLIQKDPETYRIRNVPKHLKHIRCCIVHNAFFHNICFADSEIDKYNQMIEMVESHISNYDNKTRTLFQILFEKLEINK